MEDLIIDKKPLAKRKFINCLKISVVMIFFIRDSLRDDYYLSCNGEKAKNEIL